MDNSTILFVVTLVAAFIVLRWLISPIPQSVPEEFNVPDPARQSSGEASTSRRNRASRPVTESMIDVVHAIAPQLTRLQIRRSLERTGSVEATVNEYMEIGDLPHAPEETHQPNGEESHNVEPESGSKTLLERYGVEDDGREVPAEEPEGKWGADEEERVKLLRKRREDMILRARHRMGQSLASLE